MEKLISYAFAAFLWGFAGALLLTDRAVPAELYVAAAAAAAAAGLYTRRPGDVTRAEAGTIAADAYNEAAVEPQPRDA